MKKLIALLLSLAIFCLMIPCLAEEDITGEWYGSFGTVITLTLNADGTASMIAAETSLLENAVWKLDGDKITISSEEETLEGTCSDGTIEIDADGQMIVFTRERVEPFTPAEVKTDAVTEDFNGTWASAYVNQEGMTIPVPEEYREQVKIENGKITFLNEESSMKMLFGNDPVEMTFENGVLNYKLETQFGDEPMSFALTVEMLQDGMAVLTIDISSDKVIYYLEKTAD